MVIRLSDMYFKLWFTTLIALIVSKSYTFDSLFLLNLALLALWVLKVKIIFHAFSTSSFKLLFSNK